MLSQGHRIKQNRQNTRSSQEEEKEKKLISIKNKYNVFDVFCGKSWKYDNCGLLEKVPVFNMSHP